MWKIRIVLVAIGLLFLGAAASGIYLLSHWNQPLGPSLGLPTYTPQSAAIQSTSGIPLTTPGQSSTSNDIITSTQASGALLVTGNDVTPTPGRQPLCGGPASMTILALGSDQRGTGYMYGLADSIHVMRIDFTIPNIMVIDFPRDLWVEIPGIADHHGITHGKLNQAYLYGNPGMGYYDGPGEGPGLMARTLDLNFGMRVDHYVAIDMDTFVHAIDAVGGVDIQFDTAVDLNHSGKTPDPALSFSVGTHHLDGKTALTLARNRIPSTFQRMKYQKMILLALREKLLNPAILPRLPGLAVQFFTSVQTDLSPGDITSLICIMKEISKDNIKADSFPYEMFTATTTYDENRNVSTFIYEVDNTKLRAMITEFMNGIWPMPKENP